MRCTPTERQLEYQDWEFGVFLHIGIRTFHEGHQDWDGKPMDVKNFNPSQLDCNNWAGAAAEAGAKYMVLVCKHHDGFANWPSKYTEFSVASTPWKDGQGDVVREYVDACRKHNLGVGLYYSPAQWGGQAYDDPKDYDDYFISQISELLTGYGEIDILWFDGCGSEGHEYDWPRIIGEIRRMQPNILIFTLGDPDFRWVGNEVGLAPWPTYNAVSSLDFSILAEEKEALEDAKWLPAECDFMMRDFNWFYSDADVDTVKSVDELLGIYYMSVGRGCNMLLNIGPDRRGLLPDLDRENLLRFGSELRRRFSNPVLSSDDFERDGDSWVHEREVRDYFHLDHVVLQEDLSEGESVRRFRISIMPYLHGRDIVIFEGHNIGHKAICSFPLIRVRGVKIDVLEADGEIRMRSVEAFCTSDQQA